MRSFPGTVVGKLLVITEKPSVAKDVCAALGGFTDLDGEAFESDDFIVTFALGHLLELAEPEEYDKAWKGWTLATLPMIPDHFELRPREGQKKRLDLIRKLGRRKDVDGVVNACDAGREGEVIFRRIVEYTGLDDRPMQRLWLQSMTHGAIREAFANLQPGSAYNALADAAWLRGVGDWLVGMNATRAITKRLKGRKEKGAWSAGRVQTPTLGILVRRERELLAHIPRTYWEIRATFAHGDQTWEGRFHDPSLGEEEGRDQRAGRVFDAERVQRIVAAVQAAKQAPAKERRRKSKQAPPLPFDLTTLQREANKRFSFSAKRTLNAAQRLYEGHKLLTYPRTDSRHLPDDYGPTLHNVLGELARDVDYRVLAEGILAEGPQNLERVIDGSKVSDHFAIVPTGQEPPDSLSGDDVRIYDLVVRQFLASVMGSAVWDVVEREVEVSGVEGASFRTTARSLEVPGFLAALGQEEGAGSRLPALIEGQDEVDGVPVQVVDVASDEKETRPPARLSEAQLLRLMETAGEELDDEEFADAMKGRGLGTPATRADTIERLVDTHYARRVDGKIGAEPKGMRLMDVLERARVPALGSPELTGQWEWQLHKVEDGELPRSEVLAGLTAFTREIVDALKAFEHETLWSAEPALGRCPSCDQANVVESSWGYRCERNTIDPKTSQCKFFLWKDRFGRYIDRALVERVLANHHIGPVPGFVDRFGRALEGTIDLVADEKAPGSAWTMKVSFGGSTEGAEPAVAEEQGEVVWPCPCGEADCGGVVETNQRYVCQRLLDGRAKQGPALPKVICQRAIQAEEAAPYFAEGGTAFLEGFTSKRNRPFTGKLVRRANGRYGFEFMPRPPRGAAKKGGAAAVEGEEAPKAAKKAPATKATATAKKPAAKKAPAAKKPAAKKVPAAKAAATVKKAPAAKKPKGSEA